MDYLVIGVHCIEQLFIKSLALHQFGHVFTVLGHDHVDGILLLFQCNSKLSIFLLQIRYVFTFLLNPSNQSYTRSFRGQVVQLGYVLVIL